MDEYNQNLHEIRKSVEKSAFVFILTQRLSDIREELEDINLKEHQTAALRGGIIEIRNLLDLINSISSQVD